MKPINPLRLLLIGVTGLAVVSGFVYGAMLAGLALVRAGVGL